MMSGFHARELSALRRELFLRIALQNGLLLLAVAIFTAFTALVVGLTAHAPLVAAAHGAAGLALALQWCHHGVRTMQIKQYVVRREADRTESWERWLPANRPRRLLGTRWMVSTKGVFLGLQGALLAFAASVAPNQTDPWLAMSLAALLLSAGFLLSNPKE